MSEFNPSSRKETKKKKREIPEPKPVKKPDLGERRRQGFGLRIVLPLNNLFKKILGIQGVDALALLYCLVLIGILFKAGGLLGLLIYGSLLLGIYSLLRYFYPESFKVKR